MDNKNNIGSPDRKLINTSEDYELEYWSKKFNVSREKLKEAVKAAGSSAQQVEQYLKSRV